MEYYRYLEIDFSDFVYVFSDRITFKKIWVHIFRLEIIVGCIVVVETSRYWINALPFSLLWKKIIQDMQTDMDKLFVEQGY